MSDKRLTGDQRCWPCTVANATVGVLVGWLPVGAALVDGSTALLAGTLLWGLFVSAFTLYRLLRLGYLPFAESVAKWTRLHTLIGPSSDSDDKNS